MTIKSISGMIIDGVAASEAIDSSGEILDVKGCDTSDLENGVGVLNYEHRGDDANGASPNDVVGKIIFCKKIFKKDECDDKRQEFYWDKVKLPFIYIKARLYDGAGHPGAIAAAAMIRDHHANNEPILARYSIEGSTLKKEGNRLMRSMARKVALTLKPCNKSAISGLLSDPNGPNPVSEKQATKSLLQDLADTVKSEFASYEMEVDPLVKDEPMIKTLEAGGYDAAPSTLTQGSSLQREDLGPTESLEAHRERVRNQLKAALRDYDPFEHKDTKKFLKHYLPEADDSYREYFENLISDVKEKPLKQILINATTKMEYFQLELRRLLKATSDPGTTTNKEIAAEGSSSPAHPIDQNFINAVNDAQANIDPAMAELIAPAVPGENGTPQPQPDEPPVDWERCPGCKEPGRMGQHGWDFSCPRCGNAWDRPKREEPAEPAAGPAAEPAANVVFHGLNVKPGVGFLTGSGKKVAIVGIDHNNHPLIVPEEKLGNFKDADVMKIDPYSIRIDRNPVHLDPPIVAADRHTVPEYTFQDEQRKLVDGLDMASEERGRPGANQDFRRGIVDGMWKKVLGGTDMAYVKPHAGGPSAMPTNAEAEGLYHNLMHQFFGTGQYISTVTVFRNPKNGHLYHAIRRIPNASHHEASEKQMALLRDLHSKGELDKLLLTNSIMQNSDRHHNNFMYGDNDSKLFMIDHGFSLHGRNAMVDGGQFPHYYDAILRGVMRDGHMDDKHEIKLHPAALEWLKGLDPEVLRQLMFSHGAPENVIKHTTERLKSMKDHAESVTEPGVIETFAAAEPHSRRFEAAKEYRRTHDPEFMAAEKERKRLLREAELQEQDRQQKKEQMYEHLADLREDNPDLAIHDLAALGGYNPDVRHALQVNRGVDALQMTPDGRAQLDANIHRYVMDLVGNRQRERRNHREDFVEEMTRLHRQNPHNQNSELFPSNADEEQLGIWAKRFGIKRKEGESGEAYRGRLNAEFAPQVKERVQRRDLEEAHNINDERDAQELKDTYHKHFRNMVASFVRENNLLHSDHNVEPTEASIAAWLPVGNELDKFARSASKAAGGIETRNGRSDEEYRNVVAHALMTRGHRQHGGWGGTFGGTIQANAAATRNTARSYIRSVLDYIDGGYDPEKIKERLNLGLSAHSPQVRQLLSYYGLDHGKSEGWRFGREEQKPIIDQLYQKLVDDPLFEKIARERAKVKAFIAYEARQKELKEKQNRQKGQGKRRRTKMAAKVAEQKPAIQQKIDDPARGGTHGTPEQIRKLREAIAELEAKGKLKTAPEQIRMFPKE